MKQLFTFILLSCTLAASSQDGREILQKAALAIKSSRSIHYNLLSHEYGNTINVDVIVNRKSEFPVFGVSQLKVSGIEMTDHGAQQVSFAFDGVSFEFLDIKKNLIIHVDSPTIQKVARVMFNYQMLPLIPYMEKEPFEHVLKAKSFELLDDTIIYNHPVHTIRVTQESESPVVGKITHSAIWYIGKKDHLLYGLALDKVKKFVQIKSTNAHYDDNFFHISANYDVKKVSGLEPVTEGLLAINTKAPDWTLPTATGHQLSLSSLKGKVVMLDFWGTWCVPCIKAMPEIQAIHDHFKGKDVAVIGVSVEMEEKAKPVEFVKRKGFTYTIALDGKNITKDYKVINFPSIYLIDKNGNIVHAEHGIRENFREDMMKRIDALLKDQN